MVEVDGRRLPDRLLAGRQGRLALAYLVCERHRSVPREELADLVWGDDLPASWASSLSVVISRLRKLLSEAGLDGAEALAAAFGSYRLHLPADATVDYEEVARAVQAAELGVRDGDVGVVQLAGEAARTIAERGFLTDDCPWVDAQRDRLRDFHVRAVQAMAEAHRLAGERSRAVLAAREAVKLDELREASYRLLMETLAAAGERAEALRVWERCRVMLAEELGVDPSPETESVYLSLLRDEPSPPRPTLPTGVVTFLLTDIVDSTGHWERNPAAMGAALERHDRLVSETVTAHGGSLLKSKLEGDATVSVFPRTSAGAAAAVALQAVLAAEPWPKEVELAVRMALHTGEAVERDGDYFGPALNRAARLRALAGGGQIVVSQAVAEVVRDHLPEGTALRSLGERQLRGSTRSEHVHELVPNATLDDNAETASLVGRPPFPAILHSPAAFVGRGAELERLSTEWANATAGAARAVLVGGEPGVGKTRLAGQWAGAVWDQGALVLYGRCDEELGAPYQPFAEALRALLPHTRPGWLRALRGVEELARLEPGLASVLPGLASPTQSDPDTERYLLFDAVARLLAGVSAETPILLVVDDLHWAARPTLLMLRHLLRAGDGTRLQIVGTYRSTDLARSKPLAAAIGDLHADGATERLPLVGLEADEVGAYVSAAGYNDDRLGPALATVTAGNPFFMIEVLRHVEESGGVWDPTSLPQGVREAVTRRLTRLSEGANEALLIGAIAGSRFSLGLIEHVADRDLVDEIDEARQAGMIVEEPNGRFRFEHALLRQSLLAEVASVKRVRLHQRIATALEEDASFAGDAPLADLARHWFECAYAGGAAKAVDYARRAAEEAMTRLAYEEAAALLDQAVQAAEIEDSRASADEQSELLLARCEALLAAGDPAAVPPVLDQLRRVEGDSPRFKAWGDCYAAQLAVLTQPERLDATADELPAIVEELAALGDAEGEAKAHTVLATCLARLGRVAACEAALDRALVAARQAGNPRRVNAVLAGAPVAALWGPSPVPRASGRCLDVVRVLRITTGSPAVEAVALRCQAVLEAARGRPDAARRMIDSARRTLDELGHRHGVLEADLFAGIVELYAGEPAQAEAVLRRAYDGFAGRRVGVDAAQAAALLARALLAQDKVAEALALTADAEAHAGADLKAAIAWRSARAEALALQGTHAEALDTARTAVALADATDALLDRADAHLALGVVLRAAGDRPAAEREIQEAVSLYDRKGATACAEAAGALITAPVAERVEEPIAPAAGRLVNRAHQTFSAVLSAGYERQDWDAVASMMSPDIFIDDRRPVIGGIRHEGRDAAVELIRSRVAVGVTETWTELIATRGERLALEHLMYRGEGFEMELGGLVEVDSEGLYCGAVVLEPDDLDAAYDELDARYIAGDGAAFAEVWQTLTAAATAINQRDWDAMRGTAADNFVCVDRRMAGWGTLDVEGYVEHIRELAVLAPDVCIRVSAVLAINRRGAAYLIEQRGTDANGGRFDVPLACILLCEAGRITRFERFEAEDTSAVLARFAELTAQSEDPGQRYARTVTSALVTGDWEPVAKLMTPDVVSEDHRRVVGGIRVEGLEDNLSGLKAIGAVGVQAVEVRTLATRGERLALYQDMFRGPQGEAGLLAVVDYDEAGLIRRSDVFDEDDLDAAYDELEARYLAGEGAPFAESLGRWLVVVKAVNAGDGAGVLAALSDNFVGVSWGRSVMSPALDRAGYVEFLAQGRQLIPDLCLRVTEILRVKDVGALAAMETTGHDLEGGAMVRPNYVVTVAHPVTRLIERLEFFDPEDADVALARFEELTADSEGPGQRYARAVTSALVTGDWEEVAKLMTADVVVEDHRPVVGGIRFEGQEANLSSLKAIAEVGVRAIEARTLATRGARLELYHTVFGGLPGEVGVLAFFDYDDSGLVRRSDVFDEDDLDAAYDELDARYMAGEGGPFAGSLGRWMSAIRATNTGDEEALLSAFSDSLVVVFPSLSLTPPLDRAGYLALLAEGRKLIPDIRVRVTGMLRIERSAAVVAIETTGHDLEGGAMFRPNTLVLVANPETALIERLEFFDGEEVDAAIVRFEELTAVPEGPGERFARMATSALGTGDWEPVMSLMCPDVLTVDHRRLVGGMRLEGQEANLAAFKAIAEIGARALEARRLACRGERLILYRVVYRGAHGEEVAALLVLDVGVDGLLRRGDYFDEEDLDAAYDELDARYIAGEGAPVADSWRRWTGVLKAVNAGDDAAVLSSLSDTFVAVIPLLSFMPPLDREGYIAQVAEGRKLIPDVRIRVTEILRITELGAVVAIEATGHDLQGGVMVRPNCLVLIADPDAAIIERFEFFDPEDADPALTRFEELTQESQDPVERLARALTSAFVTRQWQPVANLLSPDVVAEDHRRVVGRGRVPGREASMASFKTIAEVGARRVDVRRLASRGPRLELHHALFRGSEGEEVAALTVFEFDAAGLLRSYDVFDEDDLDAAYDELDARYMAGEGAPFAESLTCWRQVLTATNSGDNAAVLSSLSPDLVAVFRGSLMAPPLDREGYVAAIAEGRKLVPDRCIRVMEMLRVRRSGAVAALESSGHDLEGGAIVWKSVLVVIAHPETALIERIEFFDPEDVDAALARFEELTAGPEDPGQRFERTVNAAFRTGDWAALTALYHPRAVLEDRRSVVGGGRQIRGPGAIVREIAAAREVGATEVVTGTLATRGGLLRLHHHTYRGTAGELSAVAVSELDSEGSIRAVVMFDDVDLEAAYDELAARYLAGEGAPFADSLARWTRLMDAAGVGDDAAVLSMLSDNFVAVFPTRSMTPSLDGLGFVALLAEGRTLVPDVRVRVTELLRISRFSALAAIEGSGHDREGGAMVRPSLAVLVEHPDRHLIERVEFLDPEDIDAAIARFEELTAEPPDPGERYAREVTSALVSGNWEPVADLMRPDVVIEDHRRVVGGIRFEGRDDNLSALKAIAELGGRALETHLLASRGGRLALHYNVFSGLPGEVPTLTVRELDAEGLLRRTDVFDEDDLGAAVALLDQRYAEGEAAPHAAAWSVVTRAVAAVNRHDVAGLVSMLSDAFAVVDREAFRVFGDLDADLLGRLLTDGPNVVPDERLLITAVHALADRAGVFGMETIGHDVHGGAIGWGRIVVGLLSDAGLIEGLEYFDAEAVDAAIARFEELTAEPEDPAQRYAKAVTSALVAGDWEPVADLMSPDVVTEDHRRVVGGMRFEGRDANLSNLKAVASVGPSKLEARIHATRGERLALYYLVFRGPQGEVGGLAVSDYDPDGRIRRTDIFDEDDLDAAYDELDRRYAEGEAARYAAAWSITTRVAAAWNRRDVAGLGSMLSDAFAVKDRQTLRVFGDNDGDLFLGLLGDVANVLPDERVRITAVPVLTDRGGVFRIEMTGHNLDGGAIARPQTVVGIFRDAWLIDCLEFFDGDAVDAAISRFEELTAEREPPGQRFERAANAAYRTGDWAPVTAQLHPDAVLEDRRRVLGGGRRIQGADAFVAELSVGAELGVSQIVVTAVATRGERLGLNHASWRGPGTELNGLSVFEVDSEGLMREAVLFDENDIDAAYAELDRRYAEGEAAPYARVWALATRVTAALNASDLVAMRLILSEDFVVRDRQALPVFGPGDRQGYLAFLTAGRTLVLEEKASLISVLRLTDRGWVGVYETSGHDELGSVVTRCLTSVVTVKPDDDVVSRLEFFDHEDVAAALARFEELTEDPGQRFARAVNTAYRTGDWIPVAARYHPDAVLEDRRSIVGGGRQIRGADAIVTEISVGGEVGVRELVIKTVATRGERLRLLHQLYLGPGTELNLLSVSEVDSEGVALGAVMFDEDDLDAAYEELDRRYAEGEAAPHARAWALATRTAAALSTGNLEAMRSILAEDFVCRDRQALTIFGRGDRDGYLAFLAAGSGLLNDEKVRVTAVLRLTGRGWVAVCETTGHDGLGSAVARDIITVMTMRTDDEVVSRFEFFDPEDADAALARFEELTGGQG